MLKLNKIDPEKTWAFYLRYPGQTESQPVNLVLNLSAEEVDCEINFNIGPGMSIAEYHGIERVWLLPEAILATSVNHLMDRVEPLLRTILDNSEVVWDGNNHVAKLNDVAIAAEEEIDEIIRDQYHDESDCAWVLEPADYFEDSAVDEILGKGNTVEEIAEYYLEVAESQNILIVGDLETFIDSLLESER